VSGSGAWTGADRSSGYGLPVVSLRPLEESDREAVDALRVSPGQERFVSSVADSLREAAEHPGAHAQCWVVHDGDTPVGFVMIADEVDGPDYVPHYLWKLLIDERHQGRGFGTATLDLVVDLFRGRPDVEVLTAHAGQGEGSPIAFYERYGFQRTGEVVDGEVELQLRLT
jgi:diamine N-acetyltransferase